MPSGHLVVQPLSGCAVAEVAALHAEAIPYSLNSRLGTGHLAQLYRWMLERDGECRVLVAVLDGEVAGVVSVALDPDRFVGSFLGQLGPRQVAGLAVRMALRPALLLDWRESRNLSAPLNYQGQRVWPCLSAIAVAESRRRSGVGRALVAGVDGWIRANNYPAYFLDTLAENQAARAFYRRLGFVEVEQRGKSVMLVKGV